MDVSVALLKVYECMCVCILKSKRALNNNQAT